MNNYNAKFQEDDKMSEKKNSRFLGFVKSNLYYLLIGVALITIIAVTAVVIASGSKKSVAEKPKEPPKIDDPVEPDKPDDPNDPDKPDNPDKPDKPKDTEIIFNMPVQNATFSKKYTHDTIVFNKTLGVYTGHTGLDISAEEGSKVVCVYDGVVESVTTSYLQGTTVTIDHGNGLKTVYNSIEAKEGLAAGQALKAGDEIGAVSDNNRQEYKDGAHLHFEVLKDGAKVDPEEYFAA